MIIKWWYKNSKLETILLGVILYGLILTYMYNFLQMAGKYEPWTTDEFFYYMEAKAISAYDIYQTPASLDGNTSFIGNFGFHGVSYAIKDGFLAKLFFQAEDPPILLNNFLTMLVTFLFIILFKEFTLNIRLKIAIAVAVHHVLYYSTFSYMQETIHYLFAVLALRCLYLLYKRPELNNKYLYYYLVVVITAITFRYGWFIWGLGLLPLAKNLKTFTMWSVVMLGLLAFGIFISRKIAAPYPYDNMVADRIMGMKNFSLFESLGIIFDEFKQNIQLYLISEETITTICMRYLLLLLLCVNTYFALTKRSKFTIACAFIGWAYFFSGLAFYHVYWGYDERSLAVLYPLLCFSIIGNSNHLFFYLMIVVQFFLLPGVIKESNERNLNAIATNTASPERSSREASFAKVKDLIPDTVRTVVSLSVEFVIHGTPNYFIDFPLVNGKGYPIHYRLHMYGTDRRGTNIPQYVIATHSDPPAVKNQLIYSDKWMYLYKILD